ncbi:hydroxymethylglutaryl-CoA reductase, degradative [Crocinitomicaceae bacterium CZZ-1]|uniref:3-hydroxy-3-methylglutaryl coenzyme A reductase n=1 Tax=Taishania pollutisoli TaxID=2766479 RepID=A0A8J6P737_9FLAO|nr:hydroxymethylglutaryl-CoA reductase, degradative [Taishania pollutisoli]MBC9811056.1 hydroxymethylglutaryl-CoA reductase, degradative [Taishania pollutisoli]
MEILIEGFSKKNKQEKLEAIAQFFKSPEKTLEIFKSFDHPTAEVQEVINEFSENTISNFHLPYSIAPNFLINGKTFAVPMVIEESSVVAAASKSAKFWYALGGFHTEIVDTEKVGQVHFLWHDDIQKLTNRFDELKQLFINGSEDITVNMRNRGGGIKDIVLKDLSDKEPGLMQLFVTFETIDSMGANFVNSCLERFAEIFRNWHQNQPEFKKDGLEIIMSILSNLTPNCVVKCWVETDVKNLDGIVPGISGKEFAKKFHTAVRIAQVDPYRATTHNKGIYNGVDAVVLATGNDFRAVEACGHAYASIHGNGYSSLTNCTIENDTFRFELTLPIAMGVVGGLTNLHPLVKLSHELLDFPNARELMGIAAAAGLANNFGAVKSLTTTGIQQGHMKMHLFNIMNQLEVKKEDREKIVAYFKDKNVSVSAVRTYVESLQLA